MAEKPDLFDAARYPHLRRQSQTSRGLCTLLEVTETSDGFLMGWARFDDPDGSSYEHSVFLGCVVDFMGEGV